MGLSKLTAGHIAIIGVVLALLIGGTFYALGPHKTSQNLRTLAERESAADTQLMAETKNKKDKAAAQQEVAQTQAQFAKYERRLMPKPAIDLTKPTDERAMTVAMIELWKQPYKIATMANRFARDQARRYKVRLLSPPFSIAGQPTDPAAIPNTLLVFPMGTIQVSGSFQNVNDYMRSWNRFNRLVALDGFQLSTGPDPVAGNGTVVGQATVTCYVFPKTDPAAAAAAAAGGGTDPYGGGYGGGSPYGAPPGGRGGGNPGYGG
jgi:Tfp pilus assembly protein PilO